MAVTAYYTQQHTVFQGNNLWQYTSINVPSKHQPFYRLFTGGEHRRFILASPSYTRYWGETEDDYYGVNLLHNPKHWQVEDMPIAPIFSADVERSNEAVQASNTQLTDDVHVLDNAYYQYWANHFAKDLLNRGRDFLSASQHQPAQHASAQLGSAQHSDQWRLFPITLSRGQNSPPHYDKLTKQWKRIFTEKTQDMFTKVYNADGLYGTSFALRDNSDNLNDNNENDEDICPYIDWSYSNPYPLIYFHKPLVDDGRVKWWRKKVKKNTCPPLLVWYQEHLQAHLLIDGHARLQAFLLEDTLPKVICISHVLHHQVPKTDETKAKDNNILTAIHNNLNYGKKPINVDELNRLLIETHSPSHDYHRVVSIGKLIAHMDSKWSREVTSVAQQHQITEVLTSWLQADTRDVSI